MAEMKEYRLKRRAKDLERGIQQLLNDPDSELILPPAIQRMIKAVSIRLPNLLRGFKVVIKQADEANKDNIGVEKKGSRRITQRDFYIFREKVLKPQYAETTARSPVTSHASFDGESVSIATPVTFNLIM